MTEHAMKCKKYLWFRKSWVTKSIEDRIIFENLSQFESNFKDLEQRETSN